jgi:hypothetical protein
MRLLLVLVLALGVVGCVRRPSREATPEEKTDRPDNVVFTEIQEQDDRWFPLEDTRFLSLDGGTLYASGFAGEVDDHNLAFILMHNQNEQRVTVLLQWSAPEKSSTAHLQRTMERIRKQADPDPNVVTRVYYRYSPPPPPGGKATDGTDRP